MRRTGVALLACLGWNLALAMGTPPQQPAKSVETAAGAASVMLRDDDLRGRPDAAAPVLAHLAKGVPVRVLAGEGGWTRVSAGGRTGWVRVLSVRSAAASGPDLAGIAQAGSTPSDPGKVVAVAGVRGLDEETLQGAVYDAAQMNLLDSYALGREEAEQFAQAAGLRSLALPYFQTEAPAASGSGATQHGTQ